MRNTMNLNQERWPRWKAEGNYLRGSMWEIGSRQSGIVVRQNLDQETEDVRQTLRAPDRPGPHGSGTPIKHTFPQEYLALQKDSPLSYRNEAENSGLGPLGESRGWGSTVQLECDPPAVAVTWPYGDALAGSKGFMGGAGRGPCAASADLWGRLSQEYDVLKAKVQRYLLEIWTKAEEGQLSTSQHPVG